MLRWRDGCDLASAAIHYLHRGAPDDERVLDGSMITALGSSFIEVGEASIPYHRVFKIIVAGRVVFQRAKPMRKPER